MSTDGSTSARWTTLRVLIEEALTLPAGERLAFLRSSIDEPALLAEAEQLLAFDQQASRMFPVTGWKEQASFHEPEQTLAGTLLGSYRILHEIGRGGMGAVYLAERADGAYEQKVAIKLLQESLATPEMRARFRTERQILAALTHPGIVRLLDGGVTPAGRPYLVLDYVDGLPIDRYCEEQRLDTTARLRLFIKVAEVIQAAHQQLTLHLDLKPANILITPDGEPHLLDFGIARLVGDEGLAQPSLLLMTPRYASPEQAEGKPLGVASDVFSLATLLYRLLTGVLPYPIEDANPLEAARMIRETTPLAPSKVVPPAQASVFRGDLDVILLQALRKEPARRYPTVFAFAEDLERYLTSRPVLAHGDSVGYRANKFLRRNWIAATAATLVVAAAVLSGTLIVRSAREARRHQAIAEQRLKDVRAIANSSIVNVIPALEEFPGTLDLRKQMVTDGLKYLTAMAKEQSNDPDFDKELARGFYTMGELQGNPHRPSFGERNGAVASYQQAIALEQRSLARKPNDPVVLGRIGLINSRIANILASQGDMVGSLVYHEKAYALFQPVLQGPKNTRWMQVANEYYFRAHVLGIDNEYNFVQPEEALLWLDRALLLVDELGEAQPKMRKNSNFLGERAYISQMKAAVLSDLNRTPEAIALLEKELVVMDELHAQGTLNNDYNNASVRLDIQRDLGQMMLDQGNLAKAAAITAKMGADTDPDVKDDGDRIWQQDKLAVNAGWYAQIHFLQGKTALARKEMEQSVNASHDMQKRAPDFISPTMSLLHHLIAFAELKGMPPADAKPMFEEVIAITSKYTAGHPTVLSSQVDEARAHLGLARIAKRTGDAAEFQTQTAKAHALLAALIAQRPHNFIILKLQQDLDLLAK